MDEPLRKEAAQEPFDHAVAEMQLDHIVVDALGSLENHGADWRRPAPLEGPLPVLRHRPQRIQRRAPGRVRAQTAVKVRKLEARGTFAGVRCGLKRRCSEHLQRARQRVAEVARLHADPAARLAEACPERVDLPDECRLTLAGRLEFLRRGGLFCGIQRGTLDLGGDPVGLVVSDAPLERGRQATLEHLREAPQFRPDRLRLADQGAQHPVLGPLVVDKIMAEHFG